MCTFYDERYYQLSSVSGYSASYDEFIMPSFTLTTIDTTSAETQSMYTFEQISA